MLKVTDLFIKKTDVRYVTGPARKEKAEIKAAAAIPGVKGVAAVPAEKDKVEVVAVKGKAAIKAVAAVPAVPAEQTMYVFAKSKKILEEIVARLAAEKVLPTEDGTIKEFGPNAFVAGWDVSNTVRMVYVVPNRQVFTEAFKKAKSKDSYNKAGWLVSEGDRKAKLAKKAEKAKAEKDAKDKKVKAEKAGKDKKAKAEKDKKAKAEEDKAKPAKADKKAKPAKGAKVAKATESDDAEVWGE